MVAPMSTNTTTATAMTAGDDDDDDDDDDPDGGSGGVMVAPKHGSGRLVFDHTTSSPRPSLGSR